MEIKNKNLFNKGFTNPKVLWSIVAGLLIIVIVGSMYWWQAEQQTTQNLQQASQTNPIQAEEEHIDAESHADNSTLSGTKVYHSDSFHFEISIPSNWTASSLGSKNEVFFNSGGKLRLYFTSTPVSSSFVGSQELKTINGIEWTTMFNETAGWYYQTEHKGRTYVFQPGDPKNDEDLEVLSTFEFTNEEENHTD